MHQTCNSQDATHGDGRTLKRRLENRHIQLIAISGAIGTGLFMGSGKMIALSGSSIILVYAIIGFFVFCIMRAMGEMLLANLEMGSFAELVHHYLGPRAGFILAWSYWLSWVVVAVGDVVVVAGFLQYWYPHLPTWIPAFSTMFLLLALNMLAVKAFGEVEFWFGLIKIIAIVALVVTGLVMVATSYTSPAGVTASFSHLVAPGVMMPHGILGFLAGFQIAIFSFVGTELLGTAAAEAHNPEKTLPKAINTIPLRILLFYVTALACIISVISWANVPANRSPFVELFLLGGLPAAAGMINFVVMTSAASSANSGVYSGSRMLYGLSHNKQAPQAFGRLSGSGTPVRALVFSGLCMAIALTLLFAIPDIMVIFTLVSTISAVMVIVTWSLILLSYFAYRRSNHEAHLRSTFKLPGGRFTAGISLAFLMFVLCLLALEPDTRTALYVMPIWYIGLLLAYRHNAKATVYPAATTAS
ncbi:amino acid transporter [Pseudomonas chlororaphis]|jgi:D-serine/D-alanine/glycine transporter|uniref:Amino acid permease n=1 Tax=Pseudomonas morbosilactucae TaxID=2938197 RepID=A0ABT0JHG8_9PSED|nr:amino acid permease [Pseudomonas morbosilactucae]MCK9815325.1 amino acid permease [Pseudomonas morbosilactucae]ROL70351.1 amino acid transporter [Pseudomonas chlororaphis]